MSGCGSAPPTFLFVDDEVRILSALRRTLRREGYRILTAETAEEALQILEQQPVDVIVTDQKMPSMSGLQLLAQAARLQPDARRLLITGWTEAVPPGELEALGIRAMIPKPWNDGELKSVLRAQLEA